MFFGRGWCGAGMRSGGDHPPPTADAKMEGDQQVFIAGMEGWRGEGQKTAGGMGGEKGAGIDNYHKRKEGLSHRRVHSNYNYI